MFRLKASGLPPDASYPADLEQLGYRIDPATDEIRNIAHPSEYYRFYVNRNQRHNEVFREAVHTCIRREVIGRLERLGLKPLYLPHLTTTKPTGQEPHVAIMCTPPEEMRKKRRIVLINNSSEEDLAIWSYRVTGRVGGIGAGSAVSMIEDIIARATRTARAADPPQDTPQTPGFIILNPGHQLFSHRLGSALSYVSWDALPRASTVSDPTVVHPLMNRILGSKSPQEHVDFVLKHVLGNDRIVDPDGVEIYAIGLRDGAITLAEALEKNWSTMSERIICLAMTACNPVRTTSPAVNAFLQNRTRCWSVSDWPVQTVISPGDPTDPDKESYPTLASGEKDFAENVFPACFRYILDWFEEVFHDGQQYKNGRLKVPDMVTDELARIERESAAPVWDDEPTERAADNEVGEDVDVDVDAHGNISISGTPLKA